MNGEREERERRERGEREEREEQPEKRLRTHGLTGSGRRQCAYVHERTPAPRHCSVDSGHPTTTPNHRHDIRSPFYKHTLAHTNTRTQTDTPSRALAHPQAHPAGWRDHPNTLSHTHGLTPRVTKHAHTHTHTYPMRLRPTVLYSSLFLSYFLTYAGEGLVECAAVDEEAAPLAAAGGRAVGDGGRRRPRRLNHTPAALGRLRVACRSER
eukprot:GHVU01040418.1.p1 GENE.GHVU01040418.1~~GHVU01040418.1.p1  ORF type:complete len:210 (+),score=23.05 GHVU01040418.1:225-854(+)